MSKRMAIVLKTFFPKKRKIAVLESSGAQRHYVPHTENVGVGYLIYYQAQDMRMQNIERVVIPFDRAREDILFLHHLIELCYYFMPVGDTPVPSVFALVRHIYDAQTPFSDLGKKLLLARLYLLLGIVPEDPMLPEHICARLMHIPVDMVVHEPLDLETEHILSAWLYRCMVMHPKSADFKTALFINSRTL